MRFGQRGTGQGGKGETAKGTSGTALCQDPMRAMLVPNSHWPAFSEPPKGRGASPSVGVELAPVSAVSSTGGDTRQHIKMGHTLSRISTVAICI